MSDTSIRLGLALVLTLWAGSGCGGDDVCATGEAGDGTYRFSVGETCLDDVTASGLSGGVWSPGASLAWELDAAGGYRVTIASDGSAEGLQLHVPALEVDRMLQQGYQSWSFSGAIQIPRVVSMADDGAPLMEAAQTGDPIDEEPGVSFHTTLFRHGDDGEVLAIAALSAEVAVTGVAAVHDGARSAAITLVYGPQREPLPAGSDGKTRSEVLYIASAPTPEQAMDKVTAALSAHHASSGFTPEKPPAGWFSWNEHFADVDEALILAHAAKVETELAPLGMSLVEIDDGWEVEWGDWQANARFPGGMAPVAEAITSKGLVAGIWLAPFLVDLESTAATADASLFVEGPDGSPLIHMRSGSRRQYYVLDGTNPASMAIVTDEIAKLAAAGYTFFKLDFLYAGAIAGKRSKASTGTQALRAGLARIREVAGPGTIINACGAPILPMVGVADSLRIGPDTAFEGFDLTWSLVAVAARNLSIRAHLFPLIWLDADQVQLRAPYTLDEARAGAVAAALAGPAYSLGDDLLTLDAVRLSAGLDAAVLDMAGATGPPRPMGLMDDVGDEAPASPVIEALRYPDGFAMAPPSRFQITGASGTDYDVTFDWSGGHSVTVSP